MAGVRRIVGVKDGSFEKDGKQFIGVRIYVSNEINSKDGYGIEVHDYYISGRTLSETPLGDIVGLDLVEGYNNRVKCVDIIYVDP